MEPSLEEKTTIVRRTQSTANRYVWSFVWMVLFTALSFYLVVYPHFSAMITFWLILAGAVIQVVLQLFTFMHLNEKGHTIPIIFMALGLFIAVISVVSIILM